MGVVYLAWHLRLQKYVVVKRITRSFRGNLSQRTEVDILKNLHHPNLPQVYDFVQEFDSIYTVIDYVDGETLDFYMESGFVPTEEEAARWLVQLVRVLDYLHTQPIPVIHSDVKPGNIMIDRAGNAILIDFNVSLNSEPDGVTGYSLPYASPEQIDIARYCVMGLSEDGKLDGRSDLYSLAACFYRLLSGRAPSVCMPSVPLADMETGYSEAFLRVIDRAMRLNRNERYSSARKMLQSLERVKKKNRQYQRYLLCQSVVALLSAALIGGGIYCFLRGSSQKKVEIYCDNIDRMRSAYLAGDMFAAEEACGLILEEQDSQALLRGDPETHGQLLRVMGDIFYEREDYAAAAGYYDQALIYAQSREERTASLRGSILAYAQAGQLTLAETRLVMAKEENLDDDNLLLTELVLCAQRGDSQECQRRAAELLQRCDDGELCSRACLAAASVAEDRDDEIRWLETALQFGRKRTVLRGLMVAYASRGQEQGSQRDISAAVSYGREVTQTAYATRTDWLNYASVQRMAGQTREAIHTLETLLLDYPGDYRVLMQLAFAWDELGQKTQAQQYCAEAVSAWSNDISPDKLTDDSEEIQNLLALEEKLK